MEISLEPGKYVVAVSGGVDSVALLNLLSKQKELGLVVAHFDHGIRKDSGEDRKRIEALAKNYGLPFEYAEGKLGTEASEAKARAARYKFLRAVKERYNAKAIVTAHHQDDLVETAIINLLRGTGRKGLTSLESRDDIVRPLLDITKAKILHYAKQNNLEWREDSTNKETKYLRNYVRHEILPRFSKEQRSELLAIIQNQKAVNTQLDKLLQLNTEPLDRKWFVALPHSVAREVMASWLRAQGLREFDKSAIERAVVGAKTAKAGKRIAVKRDEYIEVTARHLALRHLER